MNAPAAAPRRALPILRPTATWLTVVVSAWAPAMDLLSRPCVHLQARLTRSGLMLFDVSPRWAPKVGTTPVERLRNRARSWQDHAATPAQKLGRRLGRAAVSTGLIAARALGTLTAGAAWLATYVAAWYVSLPFLAAAAPALGVEAGHQAVRAKRFLTG